VRRATVLLVAAVALATACGTGRIVRSGQVDTAALEKVQRGLELVRGLRFTSPVPARVLDDAEVAALIERELAREFRPGELDRLGTIYGRLGLLTAGTHLEVALRELYGDQIAALYDPRTKTLALTAGGLRQNTFTMQVLAFFTGRDLLGELLVAHELTHALQDQHYGLPTTARPLVDAHGDRTIARRALLEGDASLASVAYLRGGPLDQATVQRFSEQVAVVPEELRARHPDVPEVIRASLAFQYNTGSVFAATAYLRGGWPAIDAAHRDPPTSSEQVLHPAKYFASRERPLEVALGGTEELEKSGWTRVLEDTFGELDIRVLVAHGLDALRAGDVAAGWGGDRCRVLMRDEAVVIAWLSAWDTEADATDFAAALPAAVPDARIERRGTRVLMVVAPDTRKLVERIWTRSRVSAGG